MLLLCLILGPMLMGLVVYQVGKRSPRVRDLLAEITTIVVLGLTVYIAMVGADLTLPGVCGMGLHLQADGFRGLYACLAAFLWMMTTLFSPYYFAHHHHLNRYYAFNLVTLGATLGVFYADDLYTALIFFEIMSFTSYTWVVQEETPGALYAGQTYMAVAVFGGMMTLIGLMLLYRELGTLGYTEMRDAIAEGKGNQSTLTAAAWLTMTGFAAKAGLFPLHIWLPKAHPVAPAPASALLSGMLTKTGLLGMIVVCVNLMPGNHGFGRALLVLAVITMFVGALLALFSVDLKRTLACSSMSQIGFISIGLAMTVLLGDGGSLPTYGALSHMINHSLIKLVLFLCAAVIYMNLHQLNLNDIRGFGRHKPILHISFLLGALSLGCIPFVGTGYASKSLLHEGHLVYMELTRELGGNWGIYRAIEILFLISGGMTIAYMTKLYICIFWQKHPTRQAEFDQMKALPGLTGPILLCSALILPVLAVFPHLLQQAGGYGIDFFSQNLLDEPIAFFSGENLFGATESMTFGALIYLLIVYPLLTRREGNIRVYVDRLPAWLDLERAYRKLVAFLPRAGAALIRPLEALPDKLEGALHRRAE